MGNVQELGRVVATAIGRSYRSGRSERDIVRACDFVLEPGRLTVMIGPSGCGKSTLARLVAGFEYLSAGKILLDGREVTGPSRDILVLFQESSLFPWMTTYENVLYGPRTRGRVSPATLEFADALLTRVGLGAFKDKYPNELSGGMQRRAEIARALINQPKVMILDEPFRGLDALTKELLWNYYRTSFDDAPRTDLFITTDIDEALVLADRILVLSNRPTRVRAVFDIDIARPLDLSSPNTGVHERLREIKREATKLLHEEARRSFLPRDGEVTGVPETVDRTHPASDDR